MATTCAASPDLAAAAHTPPEHASMASLELGVAASPQSQTSGGGDGVGQAGAADGAGGSTPLQAQPHGKRGLRGVRTPDGAMVVGTPATGTPGSDRVAAMLALQSPASIPPPAPRTTPLRQLGGGPEVAVHTAAVAPPTPPAASGASDGVDTSSYVVAAVLVVCACVAWCEPAHTGQRQLCAARRWLVHFLCLCLCRA